MTFVENVFNWKLEDGNDCTLSTTKYKQTNEQKKPNKQTESIHTQKAYQYEKNNFDSNHFDEICRECV